MLSKTFSAALNGIDAFKIDVEVNVQKGGEYEYISIVGLPDMAVKESKDRIRSAILSSNLMRIEGNAVINLAPADLKKEGAAFDLAIACALLGASGQLKQDKLRRTAILGELALDGSIRPVKGALPIAAALAVDGSIDSLIVPDANKDEAAAGAKAGNLNIYPMHHLLETVGFFNNDAGEAYFYRDFQKEITFSEELDFGDVKGQILAKRAMEIAAAGGHNSLMIGPPGTGKSMLASRLNSILPPLTYQEALESSRIYSAMGLLNGRNIMNERPFRSPHHTISDVALIGGGKDPKPGEISLAHNGVLFLDELPEFKRNVLEVLRQPLETGDIHVSRAAGSCVFPADFMLVAAMNPCPCGYGDAELGCKCKIDEKRRYRKKVSGPLLDRIDLHVELRQLSHDELLRAPDGEKSSVIRQRVIAARKIQSLRFKNSSIHCNSQMSSRQLQQFCQLDRSCTMLLRQAIIQMKLSPRAYDRILKVSRTIADLANSEKITENHIFEAIQYRKNGIGDE